MREAFTIDKCGGPCFFSFCGAGETLFHPELQNLVKELLLEGHYINITTNGTYTEGINSIVEAISVKELKRLLFSFSLHYLELKCKNLLSDFRENVLRVKNAGCSILVQLNLYDGYIPYLEEIKQWCIDSFGAPPQVAATRLEEDAIKLHTQLSVESYTELGRSFSSPLFDFTMQNFNKPIHEFCYAGNWTFVVNLERGTIKPCYCNGEETDITNLKEAQNTPPVGISCRNVYCINSSHFLSLGAVPSIYKDVTYSGLRDRQEVAWFNPEMKSELGRKLIESNSEYSIIKKMIICIKKNVNFCLDKIQRKLSKIL